MWEKGRWGWGSSLEWSRMVVSSLGEFHSAGLNLPPSPCHDMALPLPLGHRLWFEKVFVGVGVEAESGRQDGSVFV